MGFLFIAGCLVLTVCGQLLVKKGTLVVSVDAGIWAVASSWWVVGGLACAGFAALSWILALRRLDLAYAYPFMSLSFPMVAVLANFFLGEEISMRRWIGLGVVVLGLVIAGRQ